MNTEILKDLIKLRNKHYPEGLDKNMTWYQVRDYNALQMLITAIKNQKPIKITNIQKP